MRNNEFITSEVVRGVLGESIGSRPLTAGSRRGVDEIRYISVSHLPPIHSPPAPQCPSPTSILEYQRISGIISLLNQDNAARVNPPCNEYATTT